MADDKSVNEAPNRYSLLFIYSVFLEVSNAMAGDMETTQILGPGHSGAQHFWESSGGDLGDFVVPGTGLRISIHQVCTLVFIIISPIL